MIDLLLVNPSPSGIKVIDYLKEKQLSYKIVITSGFMIGYAAEDENVIDLNITSIGRDLKFKSAVAWNYAGQKIVEYISSQILLRNLEETSAKRLQSYLKAIEFSKNSTIVETVSYKGYHVVLSAMIYIDDQWRLFKDQTQAYYTNIVSRSLEALQSHGIVNGPAQVILNGDDCYVKLCPVDSEYVQSNVKKHYVDIWPSVIALEEKSPNDALSCFRAWAESYGNPERFQLA